MTQIHWYTSIFRKYVAIFTHDRENLPKLLMTGVLLVLKYWPHTLVSSRSQPHLAVRGVQTDPAAINFNVNSTSISPDVCLEKEDPLAMIHLCSHSASTFTNLKLYGFAIWSIWLLVLFPP